MTPLPLLVHTAPFERRVVAALALLYAFRMLGLFMVLPVLALYGDEYRYSSPWLLGLALGAYGFSQAILQIPFGWLSDRIGRKPVILAGLLIFTLGSVVAALADTVHELILGRLLQGGGAIAGAVMALLADLTSEENRTKAMAAIGASIGVSFSLALVVGPVLAAWGGLSAIFWLTAALGLVGIYILFQVVPAVERSPSHRRELGAVPTLVRQVAFHPELWRLNLGIFVLHFILMGAFLVLPGLLAEDMGLARDRHWLVYLPMLLLAFVAMLPFIILGEKRRQMKPVLLMAIAQLGLALLALWLLPRGWPAVLGCLFLFFMAFNLLEATLPSLVSKIAPAGGKGTATGIYSTAQFAGAFAGGALGGILSHLIGASGVLVLGAILAALWWFVAWFMRPPRYLASVLLPLGGQAGEPLVERLRQEPGVVEVLIVSSEDTVYLKVDPQKADRQQLATIVAEARQAS